MQLLRDKKEEEEKEKGEKEIRETQEIIRASKTTVCYHIQ